MEHILRYPRTGEHFKLVARPNRQFSHAPRAVMTSPSRRQQLLRDMVPVAPNSWQQLWRTLKPKVAAPLVTDDQIRQELGQQLVDQRLELHRHIPGEQLQTQGQPGTAPIRSHHEKAPLGGVHEGVRADTQTTGEGAWEDKETPTTAEPAEAGDAAVKDCPKEGEPISMTSGEELLALTDGQLPGPMPLSWTRTYRSSHSRDIGLGCGWTHTACDYLTHTEDKLQYHDADGRKLALIPPALHQSSRHWTEGLVVEQPEPDQFVLRQEGEWHKVFGYLGRRRDRLVLLQLRHPAYRPEQVTLGEREPALGFAIDLHYDNNGQLQSLEGNWGKRLELRRGAHHRIHQLVLVDGPSEQQKVLAEYDYSPEGDLITHRNAADAEEHYRYRNHLIQERTLKTGFRFFFEWDGEQPGARCTRQWGERGIYDYRFQWEPQVKRSLATDSRGYTREYTYNDYGQVVTEKDPEGGLHQYAYDRGRKTEYTDPEGHTTRYFYDENKRPAGIEDALGHRVSLGYFKERPTRVKDKNGHTWTRRYDSRGLLVELTDPYGLSTHYRYNKLGLLTRATDPSGNQTQYRWSPSGELLSVTDPQGHQRRMHHDAWGQLIQVDLRLKGRIKAGSVRFAYNATGQVEKITAANGDTHTYRYNANDQLVRYSDPRGRVTEFRYDGLSQVVERIDPEGHRLQYEYDKERNLTALINENGERYEFHYDGNERLIKEVGFDGREQHYQYNSAGHLTQHLDAGQVLTQFERDALGQLRTQTRRRIGSDQVEEQARFAYDPAGQLTETYNEHQYLKFEYNPYGRVTHEHHSDLNAQRERLPASMADIRYRYVWPGRCSGLTLPDGQKIDYQFDEQLRLAGVSLNDQSITQIERDTLGRESARHQGQLTTYSDYDPAGRLTRQHSVHQQHKHPGPIQRSYDYDAFGNLSQLTDGPEQQHYVYDLLNRLKRVEGTFEETFDFDPAGNLLQQGQAQGNRLTMQGDRKYRYDARGNLIEELRGKGGKLVTQYHYNLANQLVAVEKDGQRTDYRYDPLGRRIEKRDTFGSTRYLWAGDQMVQESRNHQKKTYVYEPESFRPLALVQDDNVYHYHLDHLGTPRELTNQGGQVVWKARYKTYGNVAIKVVDEIDNPIRFQGQYFDEETGLHYNRHRYYNPSTGQFTTQDPIGLLGGTNSYQYAPNPTQWVDPTGLTCKESKYKDLKEMEPEYRAEDLGYAEAWKDFGNPEINYLCSPDERAPYEIQVKDGLLVNREGKRIDTGHSKNGAWIFVMDPQGKVYAGPSKLMDFHHSSFLAGQPIAAAGEIQAVDGILISHNRNSGHYKPDATHHDQFKSELTERGIDIESVYEEPV